MQDLGKYDQAIEYYERSLEMKKQIYGDKPHPDVAASLNNLGLVWEKKGDTEKARQYYDQAYRMFVETLGEQHPSTQLAKKNLNAINSSCTIL